MGGTPVTDKFIRQIRGARSIMGGVQTDAISDAAKAVKPVMESAVRSMTGGDMRLSNNLTKSGRPKGAIKVNYKLGQTDAYGAYARFSGSGPLPLIEQGSPPHDIKPIGRKAGGRSRRGRQRPNTMLAADARYDHPTSKSISHPGFRGKGLWAKARDNDAPPVARAAFLGRNVTAFRKAFT